jgi:excisionase family DNA binding protein
MQPSDIEILTVEQVCALLQVQRSFVYEKSRRRQRNPLPVHRIGKYLRFRKSEILRWFDSQLQADTGKRRGRC